MMEKVAYLTNIMSKGELPALRSCIEPFIENHLRHVSSVIQSFSVAKKKNKINNRAAIFSDWRH